MVFKIFLYTHVLAGIVGLLIGPIAMFAEKTKGLHTKVGEAYFYLMSLVCLTAALLSILNWNQSWWLLLVAIFSFYFALKGYRAATNKKRDWLKKHISGMLGSYIAMTTALLVVNASLLPTSIPNLIYWLLPTIIGTPLIRYTIKKHVRS